jgi:integrase
LRGSAGSSTTGRTGDDLTFGRTASEPFTDSHLRKRAREAWAVAAVGSFLRGESGRLEWIGFHECRHTYSTFLDAAGVSETRADRYMGHADHSTPGRYRHPAQLVEDAARLDEYLVGATAGKVVPLLTGARTGAATAQSRMAAQGA